MNGLVGGPLLVAGSLKSGPAESTPKSGSRHGLGPGLGSGPGLRPGCMALFLQ